MKKILITILKIVLPVLLGVYISWYFWTSFDEEHKEEFLDAEKYPTICFTADKIEFVGKIGSKTTYDMRGDLTLRGETHPIEVRVVQMDAKSLEASFSIDRTQWSVGTGPAALVISDNVDLVAKINLN